MQTTITHRGPVFSVEVRTWTDDRGRPVRRDIVRHPGAVLILPVLDDGRLVMIRNHRIAIDQWMLEFPAGKLETGESPAAAASRELVEETGYHAATIEPLSRFYTTPGFSDELMHVFVATGLSAAEQRLEAGESIQVEIMPADEVLRRIDSGGIVDGKSIAAALMWRRRDEARAGTSGHRADGSGAMRAAAASGSLRSP